MAKGVVIISETSIKLTKHLLSVLAPILIIGAGCHLIAWVCVLLTGNWNYFLPFYLGGNLFVTALTMGLRNELIFIAGEYGKQYAKEMARSKRFNVAGKPRGRWKSWDSLSSEKQEQWKTEEAYTNRMIKLHNITLDGKDINEYPIYVCDTCGTPHEDFIRVGNPGGSFDLECPNCESWNAIYVYKGEKVYRSLESDGYGMQAHDYYRPMIGQAIY